MKRWSIYVRFLGDIYALQLHVIVINNEYSILICLGHNQREKLTSTHQQIQGKEADQEAKANSEQAGWIFLAISSC